MVPPPDEQVTLRDAETARRIARVAAKGAAGDRQPTLEQLLSAFDVESDSPQARRRVASALTLAGVRTVPSLADAEPGSRVALSFTRAAGAAPSKAFLARRAAAGLVALAVVVGAAALLGGVGGGDGERADVLPTGETTTGASTPVVTAAPGQTPAGTQTTTATAPPTTTGSATGPPTASVPAGTTATTTTGAKSTTTTGGKSGSGTTTTSPDGAEALADAARRAAIAERQRQIDRRVARRRRAERARARKLVTVRLTATRPTYLCVDNGAGKRLFEGTLSGRRTFRGKQIRLNVGLSSTIVTIDGKRYQLTGSPAGVNITARRAVPLPLGGRPCS